MSSISKEHLLDEYSVTLDLQKTGEPGSGYRTRNDPSWPFQRQVVVERRGILEVRCRSRMIVHGLLSPGQDECATLLVYDINLDSTKRSRRIISATVEFRFEPGDSKTAKPIVRSIAPMGRVTLGESSQQEVTTTGGTISASGGMMPVANISGSLMREKKIYRTTSDSARVVGNFMSDEFGNITGASWFLDENRTSKSGVPSLLRCAMLLAREDEDFFQCRVRISVDADWKTGLGNLAASTPRTDPILFNPGLPPSSDLPQSVYDVNQLGSIDLVGLMDVRLETAYQHLC